MGEKNGDAKTFWMELEDNGKVDFMFEKAQDVLQSLKQKIKDGSATNKEYIQAMVLVNEATINNSSSLVKDHILVTHIEQENKPNALPSTSHENSFPEDCSILHGFWVFEKDTLELKDIHRKLKGMKIQLSAPSSKSSKKRQGRSIAKKEVLSLESKVVDFRKKESPFNSSYQSHVCSGACLMKIPLTLQGENPLQLPVKCHFQRRHAKTNSHSSALHVSYKTPCGRSLRNMEEVFHYLLATECNFLFTDNFSFNTYVQLTRNYPKQEEVVSDVDISSGVESVPVSFCNEIDNRKLPQFKYRKTIWPRAYLNSLSSMLSESCDCSEGCIDIKKCACLQLTAKNAKTYPLLSDGISTGYKYKRLQRPIPTGIYECNLLCKCNRHTCQNRVVQHGPQIRLQVFRSEKKGWGVRCLDDIDRGTFVCIYSGRLLSRATPQKPNDIDENGKQQNIMKKILSKKRKIEIACSCCETHPRSPKTEKCPPEFSIHPREPDVEMSYTNISRTQHHSVIRCPKFKAAVFHHNEKDMGFVSSDSVSPEDNNGFKAAQAHLNSKARRVHEDLSSNQVEDSEDKQLTESDVIDITRSREDTPPESRHSHELGLDNENTKKELEVQIQKSQEEKSPVSQIQQVFCEEELPSETKNTSDCLRKFSKENVFLLDASKEGNVGRFLNHSCCPNLLVQNVFVETHDRNFPLMAFFTNRYVKARTELTWDYGYEAGTMPDKEILCQCGVNKCRKKII